MDPLPTRVTRLLADLPLRAHLLALHPQHLAGIGKANRPRRVGEPAGGDPADLGRDIGPEAHHPLRNRVHQAESVRRHGLAGAGEQAVLELDQRRLDPLIAPGGEGRHQPLDDRRLEAGLRRQAVGKACGQKESFAG